MTQMGGLLEFCLVAMFALGWGVLEWQGRRLDRKRAAREAAEIRNEDGHSICEACGTAALPERGAFGNDRATDSRA